MEHTRNVYIMTNKDLRRPKNRFSKNRFSQTSVFQKSVFQKSVFQRSVFQIAAQKKNYFCNCPPGEFSNRLPTLMVLSTIQQWFMETIKVEVVSCEAGNPASVSPEGGRGIRRPPSLTLAGSPASQLSPRLVSTSRCWMVDGIINGWRNH